MSTNTWWLPNNTVSLWSISTPVFLGYAPFYMRNKRGFFLCLDGLILFFYKCCRNDNCLWARTPQIIKIFIESNPTANEVSWVLYYAEAARTDEMIALFHHLNPNKQLPF